MEKIFILGNNRRIAEQIGFDFIEVPNLKDDIQIHDWIVKVFQENEIEKLIIEIGANKTLALKLGYHIRLSLEVLREKSLTPILFVSVSSLNTIIVDSGSLSHIFATKGVYFSALNKNIKSEVVVIESLKADDYKSGFLDRIKILPDERVGRHSIANIWGAMSICKAANLKFDTLNLENTKKLYFKYVAAGVFDLEMLSMKIVGPIQIGKSDTINAKNKRILLIDDEADKGWDLVLGKIFDLSSSDDLVVINEKVDEYNSLSEKSKKIVEEEQFDLFLVDLRLNGVDEEKNLKTDEFSGMSVLRKIKSLNPGNQVIIFTASNKAWNLKALLDAGANGYYMKESPEYGYSSEFSKQNYLRFKDDVKSCFENSYLKEIYSKINGLKQKVEHLDEELKNELISQMDLFWSMILNAKSETDFANSYVTLYMIFEIVNNYFYEKNENNNWQIKDGGLLKNWEWNKLEQSYSNNGNYTGNKPPEWQKIAGLYFQKWNKSITEDKSFIQKVYRLIEQRNGFVHNDKKLLSKSKDVFKKRGIIQLFDAIEELISCL